MCEIEMKSEGEYDTILQESSIFTGRIKSVFASTTSKQRLHAFNATHLTDDRLLIDFWSISGGFVKDKVRKREPANAQEIWHGAMESISFILRYKSVRKGGD